MRATISIPEASVVAARDALAVRLSWLNGALDDGAEYVETAEGSDTFDEDGIYTGPVAGRVLRFNTMPTHVIRVTQEELTAAGVLFDVFEVDRSPLQDEDQVDAHLGHWSQRRPGHKYEAFGTFAADGTKPSQTISTSGTRIDQWNDVIDLRGMTKFPATGQVSGPAGDYEIKIGIEYDAALSPGVVWTVQATVGNAGVGPSKTTDNGTVRGRVVLSGLLDGDRIGIGIAPNADGSEFKILQAKVRVSRI